MDNDMDHNNTGLKRRDFLKAAGAGAVALAIPRMGFAANDGQKSMDGMPQEIDQPEFQVLGLKEKSFVSKSAVGVKDLPALDSFLNFLGHHILLS